MRVESVRQVAEEHQGLVARIDRAISFDWRLMHIWDVPVEWNFRLRNRAGNANARRIHLHPGLQAATREELLSTFLHELAHVCEWTLYGHGGHSGNRYEAMIRLGEKPWDSRYHSVQSCMKAAARQPGLTNRIQGTLEDLGL